MYNKSCTMNTKRIFVAVILISILSALLGMFLFYDFNNPENDSDKKNDTIDEILQMHPEALIVAANDSSDSSKSRADYLCDGKNDEIEILQAFNDVGQGGFVLLMEGSFFCNRSLEPTKKYQTLSGLGEQRTIIHFTDVNGIKITQYEGIVLRDFQISGKGYAFISKSNCTLQNITVREVDNSYIASYFIYASNEVIEHIRFSNCKAIDVNRSGFMHSGEGARKLIRDVVYEGCIAQNCGRYSQYYGKSQEYSESWDIGFNLAELNDLEDVLYLNCTASGCWESGFHTEPKPQLRNVRLVNCVSRDNNQKEKSGWGKSDFGTGFIVIGGMRLENCLSEYNKVGFLCNNHAAECYECRDSFSQEGWVLLGITSHALLRECSTQDTAQPIRIWSGNTYNITIEQMRIESTEIYSTSGILIEKYAKNPGEIIVKDTSIRNYQIGINNEADRAGLVKVQNVTVENATTKFIGTTNL